MSANTITNKHGVSLLMAVWMLHDDYDYVNEENYLSATSLMKPVRKTILAKRLPAGSNTVDVTDLIASSFGSAIHDGIEKAWNKSRTKALTSLGYPEDVIKRVLINPTKEELEAAENPIPVYFEQRAFKKVVVDGVTYTVGGKFDAVAEGIVQDNKTTSVYTYIKNSKIEDYTLQLSIYRWLNPDKVTQDYGCINFVFTDWQRSMAKSSPDYPQHRVQTIKIPLMTIEETEAWVIGRIREIKDNMNKPQSQLPRCSDKELWRSEPKHKYYADPTKTSGRSTKNFDDPVEAKLHLNEKGKGIIITEPGKVKACGYCDVFQICEQQREYEHD